MAANRERTHPATAGVAGTEMTAWPQALTSSGSPSDSGMATPLAVDNIDLSVASGEFFSLPGSAATATAAAEPLAS